jgi:hypothetical protein
LGVTQKCIDSLSKHDKDFEEIILINNDGNITVAKSQFNLKNKRIHIINNSNNIGFAAGVNIGIHYALAQKAEYVFLLNNDTIIAEDFLEKMIGVFQKENTIGIMGPAIAFHKNQKTVYDLGGKVNTVFGRTHHDEVEQISNTDVKIVKYISGCCMLIKKEVFATIGFFDERFFLYYEDVDFCLRAKQKGFLSAVLPTVTIYHELSKTVGKVSPFAVYYQTKSGVLFGKKYCKTPLFNQSFLLLQSCLFFLKKREAGLGAFKGFWDGLKI